MLKKDTVAKRTFELLEKIMNSSKFSNFCLFGGTALALQIGHRISDDLDFLSFDEFKNNDIIFDVKTIGNFQVEKINNGLVIGKIDDIKLDYVYEKSILLNQIKNVEGIRILSIEDIIAMKLMAICDNGSRERDYVDIACLSDRFSLNQMVSFFSEKYCINSTLVPIKPLCDFTRIEHGNVNMINKKFKWTDYENRIIEMVNNPDKIFYEGKG